MSEQNSGFTGPTRAPKANTEKQKAAAFFNWSVPDPKDPEATLLKSSKGFPMFRNQYTTSEEEDLLKLAEANDGMVEIVIHARIVMANGEKPETDLSAIPVLRSRKAA